MPTEMPTATPANEAVESDNTEIVNARILRIDHRR
jgi:hypothetical protein